MMELASTSSNSALMAAQVAKTGQLPTVSAGRPGQSLEHSGPRFSNRCVRQQPTDLELARPNSVFTIQKQVPKSDGAFRSKERSVLLSGAMGFKSVVMTAILALESIALLFMLAGLGALQDKCDEIDRLLVGADLSCHATYRYQWWLVVFNAAVQIGVVFAMINGTIVKYKVAVCALLATLTVMLMDNANEFLTLHNMTTGALADRAAVFTAGCVLAAMMHLSLIIAFGRDTMLSNGGEQPTAAYKTYENQMADRQGQQDHQPAVAPPLSYPPV
ncbi:hypothetical protein COCOBI_15-2020 [Coccomyxa sp. Obi]|nr:hypothetical protein COCOBI_15-2020 [Coccomyxa sp. Obi]